MSERATLPTTLEQAIARLLEHNPFDSRDPERWSDSQPSVAATGGYLVPRRLSRLTARLPLLSRAALELLPDPARLEAVQVIVAAIEGAPPVDLPHTRTL